MRLRSIKTADQLVQDNFLLRPARTLTAEMVGKNTNREEGGATPAITPCKLSKVAEEITTHFKKSSRPVAFYNNYWRVSKYVQEICAPLCTFTTL